MGVGFKNRKTPGVYVTELQAFPKSMVGVPTAVPVFIGYTKKADLDGKSAFNEPVKIGSMVEFRKYFGGAPDVKYKLEQTPPADLQKNPADYDFMVAYIKAKDENPQENVTEYYSIDMDSDGATNFYLYNSMRFFYENGGGDCYVLSVGDYKNKPAKDLLEQGLNIVQNEKGPTMIVMPDAVLLEKNDFKEIANKMLKQAKDLQDRVAILDVAKSTIKPSIDDTMNDFRELLELDNDAPSWLSYGIAYYPWLNTSVIGDDEISFTAFEKKSLETLKTVLKNSVSGKYTGGKLEKVNTIIDKITTADPNNAEFTEQDIVMVAPLLKDVLTNLKNKMNLLPPGGAIAGVISSVDATRGVWKAPANVNINSVISPDVTITSEDQEDMNIPLDGKAVNAIRAFADSGIVIWGARTLDGNSKDWRYVNIRRTLIYIEQSIKQALRAYLFDANDSTTWTAVKSMIEGWLSGLWEQGGLMGDKAADAFEVEVGLGSTMTPNDVLDGYMIVQVVLQMVHPVEFIELTFKQQMSG